MEYQFSANLWMFYPGLTILEKMRRAWRAGFQAIEFLLPPEQGVEAAQAILEETGQQIVLFNCLPGDLAAGEWGLFSLPHRVDTWRANFTESLEVAVKLRTPRLHLMFGNTVPGVEPQAQIDCALENLAWALPQADDAGVDLLVEALNSVDRPNYALVSTQKAVELVKLAAHSRFKVQFDVYHSRMQGEDLLEALGMAYPYLGHIQIADAPGRGQPGTGKTDFPAFFADLKQRGYAGFIGLEYQPVGETDESFGWMKGN